MTTATIPTTLAPTTGAGVPAGLNRAQVNAFQRLEKARDAMAGLEPLDPGYLAAEAYYDRLKEAAQ